ncbi:MAG TPA: protease modulator HflC [Verrucomicrobiota bacterium]|nr:protease modulator HflC [Verrucomicrobiota bacterium]
MKRNSLTLIVGFLLMAVFVMLLFCFQVRETEVALVTTFGKPTRTINADPDKPEPGLYVKWPWPVQKVQKFDKRTQNLDGKFEETYTSDKINVLVSVFAGWSIRNPTLFRERFGDSLDRARKDLDEMIRSHKNAVIGSHRFSELISTDENQLKFTEIEGEILARVQPQALQNYGVDVRFLGIKRLGLPESITQKVFDRMREERQRVVLKLTAEGNAQAANIRSAANLEREELLAQAGAKVIEFQGEAEKEAAKSLEVFRENPEFAVFLLKIRALEETLKDRTTLILDQRTPPLDLLDGSSLKSK